jgi:hypothetical protein
LLGCCCCRPCIDIYTVRQELSCFRYPSIVCFDTVRLLYTIEPASLLYYILLELSLYMLVWLCGVFARPAGLLMPL